MCIYINIYTHTHKHIINTYIIYHLTSIYKYISAAIISSNTIHLISSRKSSVSFLISDSDNCTNQGKWKLKSFKKKKKKKPKVCLYSWPYHKQEIQKGLCKGHGGISLNCKRKICIRLFRTKTGVRGWRAIFKDFAILNCCLLLFSIHHIYSL